MSVIKFIKKHLSLITLISLILGILFSYILKDRVNDIAFVGTYYIKVLKILITPIIFTSISCAIYNTKKQRSSIVIKTVVLFVVMFVATFLITSILVYFIDPAKGFSFTNVNWQGTTNNISLLDILVNLLPKNLEEVFVNPKVFFIIIVAYLFGKIVNSEKVFYYIEFIKRGLNKILEYLMYVMPIATFCLIANTVYNYGSILLSAGFNYILCAYLCSFVCVFVVMILPLKLLLNISIFDYLKKVSKIWAITLSTCSSSATLPYTIKTCNKDFNVDENVTNVVVPLGCTIHMCGGAVSFSLLGLFCAKLFNIDINIYTYILMLISSLLINMAAPGIPNGGVVIGATYLEMFGMPLTFIGFYSGIYKLLDMVYTTLNVTGDISANILINHYYSNGKEKKN